ncbi:MAG: aminotransferase class IV [Bacteroidia bacterium]|nr:aminotransferase class IV [Bacteroidia bacterium]
MYIYFNGDLLNEQANLPITKELSFLRGVAIFDFCGVRNKIPLFLDDYMDRLFNSASQVGLKVPVNRTQLGRDISNFIHRNNIENGYCKIILTGGYTEDGFRPRKENMYMMPVGEINYDQSVYTQGVSLLLDEFKREIPEVKTTNYLNAIRKIDQLDKAGAVELLYHDSGQIRECSRCNFFIVKDQVIITQSQEILKGITRKQLLYIARKTYDVEERPIFVEEINDADEAFITSTTKVLFPVVQIDGRKIGSGKVGPVSKDLLQKMNNHIKDYIKDN